ncbi:MAG TPA: cation diffusion facilitator family transporter, partial [Candidatus Gracilibacteria bacterium]|nr:cation diffusion facilitator family transporter [Candidatus Gracilibacteria bacterium]
YLGFVIFFESLGRFNEPEPSQNQALGIITVVISAVASYQMTRMFKAAGKKINSLSLMNSSKDTTIDIFVQFAVLLGIGGSAFRIPYLEGSAGMIISFMTLKVGFDAAKEALFFLLDYFDDGDLIKKIHETIMKKGSIIENVHHIKMRRAGTFLFGEAIVELSPYSDAKDIRVELRKLKDEIAKINPYLKNFSLLVSIPHPRDIKIAVPVKEEKGLNSALADTIGDTKAYVFVTVRGDKIGDHYSKTLNLRPDDYSGIADFLKKEKVEIVVNNQMSSLLYYHLRHLERFEIYPNFENLHDVESTIKLLMIDM